MYESEKGYPQPPQAHSQPGVGGAYPPPPVYAAVGAQPTVIMTPVTSTVILTTTFADIPKSCTCPVCHQNIVSRVEYSVGLLAWLIFGILCLVGCWLGCCLIPFFVDSCKDADHFCPNCNHHLSKYKRL